MKINLSLTIGTKTVTVELENLFLIYGIAYIKLPIHNSVCNLQVVTPTLLKNVDAVHPFTR